MVKRLFALGIVATACALFAASTLLGCASPGLTVSVHLDSKQNPEFELRTSKGDRAHEVLYAIVITYPNGRERTVGGNGRGDFSDSLHIRPDYGPSQFPPGNYPYVVHWILRGTGENTETSWDKIMNQGTLISGTFRVPHGGPAESAVPW